MLYQTIYAIILFPIIYIFPAYAANGAPVIFGRGQPLDRGIKVNGKRLFGNNKTIAGTASALFAGVAVGIIEYPFLHYMLVVSIALAIGTIAGDLLGSFAKRQSGIGSGASVFLLDQYGFFAVALALAYPLGHMPGPYGLLFLVALTGAAHILTNRGAYKLKLKSVPW